MNGPGSTGTAFDGFGNVPFSGTIRSVFMSLKDSGSSGTTVVDVNKGVAPGALTTQYAVTPSTIYTTQANRPTIAAAANANQSILAAQPDITSLAKGDVLTVDVDEIALGASDLTVTITVERTGDLG